MSLLIFLFWICASHLSLDSVTRPNSHLCCRTEISTAWIEMDQFWFYVGTSSMHIPQGFALRGVLIPTVPDQTDLLRCTVWDPLASLFLGIHAVSCIGNLASVVVCHHLWRSTEPASVFWFEHTSGADALTQTHTHTHTNAGHCCLRQNGVCVVRNHTNTHTCVTSTCIYRHFLPS